MSKYVTAITVEEYNKNYSDWQEVTALQSPEDVATFIDTFEASGIVGFSIAGVISKEGKYIFVVSNQNTGYDFLSQLNKLTPQGVIVFAQNAKLLYGKNRSRGYYEERPEPQAFNVSEMPDFNGFPQSAQQGEFAQQPTQMETIQPSQKVQQPVQMETAQTNRVVQQPAQESQIRKAPPTAHQRSSIPTIEEASIGDSKTEMFEEDDASATGFMEEDEYAEHGINTVVKYLIQQGNGMRLDIVDSRGLILGRSASKVDFVVDSTKVSRKHARVYLNGSTVMVQDYNSSNGTFVDGLRVSAQKDIELPIGGTLLIGDVEFKLSEEG